MYLLQGCGHDLGSVVDGKDNVGHTSCCESLDLVQNHRLVSELDERLREGEGLMVVSAGSRLPVALDVSRLLVSA